MASIIANEIKIGNVLLYKNKLWRVASTEHVKPGKGGAFMQVELRGVNHTIKLYERFRSAEVVDRISIETKKAAFIYKSSEYYVFMDQATFEELMVNEDVVGDMSAWLHEGLVVDVEIFDGNVIGIRLPNTVILTIADAEPGMKNQTASASYKCATLSNGLSIQVPQFVNIGDKVVVSTDGIKYIERG